MAVARSERRFATITAGPSTRRASSTSSKSGWKAVGLNERFRFYRYDPGQRFARHTDGSFRRDNGEQSHFTFLVYLNDGFDGGATAFHENRASLLVTPERGKALVFYHRQLHEGMPVVRVTVWETPTSWATYAGA